MTGDDESHVPPLEDLLTCQDFERAAHACMSAAAWEYISGGEAGTMARNRDSFGDYMFRPRVLRDVSSVNVERYFFGARRATPFYLSSVAKGSLVSKVDGEATFVRAAAAAGTAFLAPSVSSIAHHKIWSAAVPGQGLPFQFYLLGDEAQSIEVLKEVLALGATAIVVTVDANAPRAGSFLRATASSTGVAPSPRLSWSRLEEICKLVPTDVPVYLKGVQTGEDALLALRIGVRGIVVSNHGGRCCNDAWGSLHALEDVAQALRSAGALGPGATVELLFDSGVRSGRDALKALCLGAHGVGLGRPYYWASACHGERGIIALLELLTAELRHAMAQVGAVSLDALSPALLARVRPAPIPLLELATHGLAKL